jgi:predicted CoA-binding protein
MTLKDLVCEVPDVTPPSGEIEEILRKCKRIAIVGISPKTFRDSNRVARYLLEKGYDVVPVNPGHREILGLPCFRNLREVPYPLDMIVLFLNPARVPPVVDQAIELRVPAIWMQLGVVHNPSARKAMEAGVWVVSNLCVMKEHARLSG